MSIKLGSGSITSARIGSTEVSKIYLGSTEVWSAVQPPPPSGTVLLLHFDGANESTSFIDSSPNNLTVIANGNAIINTSQSKFGGSSLYIPSDSDYASVPYSSAWDFGSGDFTIEFWLWPLDVSVQRVAMTISSAPGVGMQMYYGDSQFGFASSSAGYWAGFLGSADVAAEEWSHCAFVRKDGVVTLFLNGINVGSSSAHANSVDSSNNIKIGESAGGAYFDELRIIKGYAAYTSNFIPPNLPFGATESLLLHMDGSNGSTTFTDSSENNIIVVSNNTTISTTQSKFGGSSAYFNEQESLSVPSTVGNFGSQDFTIEYWMYPTKTNGIIGVVGQRPPIESNLALGVYIFNGFDYLVLSNNGYNWAISSPGTIPLSINTWYHVAIVRQNNTVKVYINGTESQSHSFVGSVYSSSSVLSIGRGTDTDDEYQFAGYIDEFRIIKGYAAYTSNFNPPSLPFGANESLLMHFDGANGSTVFSDSSPNALTVTANGNATISTAQSKFGGSSAYFDGSSFLRFSPKIGQLGSENFTIECWAYPLNNSIGSIFGQRIGFSGLGYGFVMYVYQGSSYVVISNSGNNWDYQGGGSIPISTNTWHHLALVRNGDQWTYYVNGQVSQTFVYSSSLLTINEDCTIGAAGYDGQYFHGYIDEFRIVKGAAIYTSNFDIPTLPYGAKQTLLLHMEASPLSDSSSFNNTITTVGSTSVTNTQSIFSNSLYLDHSYARIDDANDLISYNSNFTIECYIYIPVLDSATGAHSIFSHRASDSDSSGIILFINPDNGDLYCFIAGDNTWQIVGQSLGHTITESSWHHIALVRNGNTIKAYLNGVGGTEISISSPIVASGPFNIGCGSDATNNIPVYGPQDFMGYIDEFRIISGAAVYTSNFTPPTSPF